jgi:hypothetical protein
MELVVVGGGGCEDDAGCPLAVGCGPAPTPKFSAVPREALRTRGRRYGSGFGDGTRCQAPRSQTWRTLDETAPAGPPHPPKSGPPRRCLPGRGQRPRPHQHPPPPPRPHSHQHSHDQVIHRRHWLPHPARREAA